ncbi:MAG: DUF2062 domain-containing protein [Verrucomicrobiaceae bacterium]
MRVEIKKRYLRLVRRAYRVLRSPQLRQRKWLQKLIHPMFDRELWHPCRDTVSSGLSIGLFVSMLPMPGQMIVAAFGAVKLRANIPLAIATCWVTNPFTQVPIMLFQERFGDFLRSTLGIPIHPFLENIEVPIPTIGTLNAGSFILGFLTAAFLLMILTYPIVYLLSSLVPKIIPKNRYKRAKAKIIARIENHNRSK